MTKEDVDKVGKGRVWTGSQAKEIGLVDELGGLSDAITAAKELAGIARNETVKLVVYPKDYSFLDVFLGAMTARTKLKVLSRWEKILSTFELLQNERRWALMPIWLTPN